MEKKKCSKCGEEKSISDFHWRDKSKNRRKSQCGKCCKAYIRSHYQNNKDYYKRKAVESNKRQKPILMLKMVEYLKKHPCVDCGEDDPVVLQFDHVRGVKKRAVGAMANHVVSVDTLMKEIQKCDVRCANCHCRRTSKEQGWKYKLLKLNG